MLKKISVIIIPVLLIIPAVIPAFAIFFADETRVCGMDNLNYPSLDYAKEKNIYVSYDFPCQFPKAENGLYERKEKIEMTGMLLDFGRNNDRSQLLIKDNFSNKERLIFYPHELNDDYIPGDQIQVKGELNKNTLIIFADEIIDISGKDQFTDDCVIENLQNNNIYCKKADGNELVLNSTESSRYVSGLKINADISDLQIADYIRVRFDKDNDINLAVVTNRGGVQFLRSHIFETDAILISIMDNQDIEVQLPKEANKNINFKINENTRIVKKYFGKMSMNDFKVGDSLYIIGRAKDNGAYEAILIKNNTVWK